jgi:uncharacterized protein YjiS (DUF1127 family)
MTFHDVSLACADPVTIHIAALARLVRSIHARRTARAILNRLAEADIGISRRGHTHARSHRCRAIRSARAVDVRLTGTDFVAVNIPASARFIGRRHTRGITRTIVDRDAGTQSRIAGNGQTHSEPQRRRAIRSARAVDVRLASTDSVAVNIPASAGFIGRRHTRGITRTILDRLAGAIQAVGRVGIAEQKTVRPVGTMTAASRDARDDVAEYACICDPAGAIGTIRQERAGFSPRALAHTDDLAGCILFPMAGLDLGLTDAVQPCRCR